MLKLFKDTRRRTVESILEKVGSSEMTEDKEFDTYSQKFHTVIQELNQCSNALSQTFSSQKVLFSDYKDLSCLLQRIYQTNNQETAWPQSSKQLQYSSAAEEYKKSWDNIHDIIRSSTASICVDDALEPIKDSSVKLCKTVEEEIKNRRIRVKDFDSYRRRLKGHELKRDQAEAQGKANTPAHADTLAEIQKFEAKVQTAGDAYRTENKKAIDDILFSKEKHDELIDSYLLTVVVAQAELFSRAYEQLNEVIKLLPPEKVTLIRTRIQETILAGGVQQEAQPKSMFSRGKTSPRLNETNTLTPSSPVKITDNGGTINIPTQQNNIQPVMNPQPISPPSVGGVVNGKEYAVALFDNEVDDEEELAFKVGDRIEVVEKDDESGWHKGRLNGRVGLFPVNYVKFE